MSANHKSEKENVPNEIRTTPNKRDILNKITAARTSLLLKKPFYGNLMMHLKFSLASCGTACTDMKRIIWDPTFVNRLTPEEIEFVMMHEVLHCALNHCCRGGGVNQYIFNIAADIVVNSSIILSMGVDSYVLDGVEVMHRTPEGEDGYLYNVEQVYDMLIAKYQNLINDVDRFREEIEKEYGVTFDNHDIWKTIPLTSSLSQEWKEYVKEAAEEISNGIGIPPQIREYIQEMEYEEKINWRVILHNFIKASYDKYDYTFSPSDRRFADSEYIMPAFYEIEGEKIENIWFNVDSSGSVDNETLTSIYKEIKAALLLFEYLNGKISFFDSQVTEPKEFDSVKTLEDITPEGGGGTSFHAIFEYMQENMTDNLPTAIIILTDGWAFYPNENMALGVPVLWIIIGENRNEREAPWGTTIYV